MGFLFGGEGEESIDALPRATRGPRMAASEFAQPCLQLQRLLRALGWTDSPTQSTKGVERSQLLTRHASNIKSVGYPHRFSTVAGDPLSRTIVPRQWSYLAICGVPPPPPVDLVVVVVAVEVHVGHQEDGLHPLVHTWVKTAVSIRDVV